MQYYENSQAPQRAVLVAVDTGAYDVEQSLDELEELARTAGAQVIARVSQARPAPDPATCIGSGRLKEVSQLVKTQECDLIIFDEDLTASQMRNIESAAGVAVVDRTTLILDIFAQRALSREGKLQVELAQQKYRLPRLMGLGASLSRLGGGIGTRGPGETQLETDRRHIRRRIAALQEQLRELERRRQQTRAHRKKSGAPCVAIVGYTNVGKSTLLNTLTGAGVLSEDKLFATLDPTARALRLPDGRQAILIDTVGLIRRLPHHLVEAFHSTLEEAAQADLILNVCDGSSADAPAQIAVTRQLLGELGAQDIPILTVFNKADRLDIVPESGREGVWISAKNAWGLDKLLDAISQSLPDSQCRCRLLVPYDRAGVLATLRQDGQVFQEEYVPEGISIDILFEKKFLHLVEEFVQL